MFSDLRGFTSFAESLPVTRVIEVLNRYLGEMSEAILDHGGTLVAYMGDGIMAVFGAPIEQADHADRGLAAAREMLGPRLATFNQYLSDEGLHDEGFRMGVGLNSGPVMSGNVGSERRLEYTAIGDTTNTAARLEGMTKGTPHMLFVAESTRDMLQTPVEELFFVDEFEVRGREAKIRLWSLPEASDEAPAATASAGPASGGQTAVGFERGRPVPPGRSWPTAWTQAALRRPRTHERRRPSSTPSTNRASRPTGSTCCPTCRAIPSRRSAPATMEPAGPDDLTPIFPMELIGQEVSMEPEVEIPDEVRDIYRRWRPSPLFRARALEKALDTPAHIYYKYEGVSPAGSHKPNSAIPQAWANKQAGVDRLVDRDRRRAVGLGAGARVLAVRHGVRRLHGRRELRPEAVPPRDDGDVGREGAALAQRHDRVGPRPAAQPERLARHRDLRGRRGRGGRRRHELRARVGAQPRLPAPDRDRAGGDRADGAGRRGARRGDRLRRRRVELRRASRSRSCAATCATTRARASSAPSRRPARRSRAAPTATTSATRWA